MTNPNNVFIGSGFLYMNGKESYKAGASDKHFNDFMWNLKLRIRRNYKNAQGEYETDFLPLKISGPSAYYVHYNLKNGDAVTVSGEIRMDGEIKDEETGEIKRYSSPVLFIDTVSRAVGSFTSENSNNASAPSDQPAPKPPVTNKKPTFDTSKFRAMKRA